MALTAAEVFRDHVTAGVPSSGNHEPKKSEIRTLLSDYERTLDAALEGAALIFVTKTAMDARLNYPESTSAWVLGDSTAANNGIYVKVGDSGTGSWLRAGELPYSFIVAEDSGAGTPNAIVATTDVPVSASTLIILNLFETNTDSPVTVSFNGGSPLTIKTASGADPVPGGLTGRLIGTISGSSFVLASDQASAAIQAAAESILEEFRSQYLGEYPVAPTADPAGNPLRQGAYYWNTGSKAHFYWDGVAFQGFPFVTVANGSVTETKLAPELRNRVTIDGGTLSAIHSSRAIKQPVFMGNGLVDGFGGDAGINTGASSGYVLDPSNGRVMNDGEPLMQIDAIPAVSMSVSDSGWTANTIRQRFASAKVLQGGTKFRIRFKGGDSGATFTSVYAGHAGAAGAFDGSQIPVTFGGATTLTLSAGEEEWSDWMIYTVSAGSAFQVSGQCTAGGTVGRQNSVGADYAFYFKAGADAGGTSGSGYTAAGSTLLWVEEIEVEQPATTENIVLVTAPFEFTEFAPNQIKVSGIIEALDALTLNTDVTIEVSRNGGTNWAVGTMTQLKALGAKTYFETNMVSVTLQPIGDDVTVRYNTLNNKRCYLHGLRVEVNA